MSKKSVGAKTILHPVPVVVVGSYNPDGTPNMMTASWVGICCSKPPCIGVSLRPATKTFHNIHEAKAFTVCIPSQKHVEEADYAGIASGKDVDKFEKTGLTPIKSELVNAPYVDEFPLILECKLYKTLELGLHTQFVGEIIDIKADESVLDAKGIPCLDKVSPIVYDSGGTKHYYSLGNKISKAFHVGNKFK